MPTDPTPTLVKRLERLFRSHRDPTHALHARAYMRDQFAFYGIPAPLQQQIWREATDGIGVPTQTQLARVARLCWRRDEREWQYFACTYLRKHIGVCSASFIGTAKGLITTKSWWDTIDSLASRTVGTLVHNHPELTATMDDWIDSPDFWLARTAILHQLAYKKDTDPDRLFRYCLRRSADREFFVRKAIGWALREYSKTDERAVRAFVRDHADELSGLSRTEALKWLERRAARRP